MKLIKSAFPFAIVYVRRRRRQINTDPMEHSKGYLEVLGTSCPLAQQSSQDWFSAHTDAAALFSSLSPPRHITQDQIDIYNRLIQSCAGYIAFISLDIFPAKQTPQGGVCRDNFSLVFSFLTRGKRERGEQTITWRKYNHIFWLWFVLLRIHHMAVEWTVPPNIVDSGTTDGVVAREGSNVSLSCRATGHPEPNITWRREDGAEFVYNGVPGSDTFFLSFVFIPPKVLTSKS